MRQSASLPRRVYEAGRPLASRLFAIPVLGYGLRIAVGILKLPRLNLHVRHCADRTATLETAWRQHIPAFLNAAGTVPALAHEVFSFRAELNALAGRLDEQAAGQRALGDRIEFVRREILAGMAHGPGKHAVAGRIVAPDKVAPAGAGPLRLNLGCGHLALPAYVNVDRRDLPGVDVVADAGALPFAPGSVDEIFSAHLLEHFPQEEMRRRLLPCWWRLLRPGGTFRAVTPDAAAMLAGAGAGSYDFEDFREVAFGSQDHAGACHFNLFTPASLRRLLEAAGFTRIDVPVSGRRNGKCFEFEISARRP